MTEYSGGRAMSEVAGMVTIIRDDSLRYCYSFIYLLQEMLQKATVSAANVKNILASLTQYDLCHLFLPLQTHYCATTRARLEYIFLYLSYHEAFNTVCLR